MDQPSYDPPEAEHRDDHDEDIEDDDTEASEDEDKTCFTPRSGIPPADPDYYDYRSQITARTEFRAQQEVEIEVKPSIMDSPFPINNKPERHARRWSHNLVLLLTHLCVLGLMEEFVRHTVMGFLTDKWVSFFSWCRPSFSTSSSLRLATRRTFGCSSLFWPFFLGQSRKSICCVIVAIEKPYTHRTAHKKTHTCTLHTSQETDSLQQLFPPLNFHPLTCFVGLPPLWRSSDLDRSVVHFWTSKHVQTE